jgi:hypothetical protein
MAKAGTGPVDIKQCLLSHRMLVHSFLARLVFVGAKRALYLPVALWVVGPIEVVRKLELSHCLSG